MTTTTTAAPPDKKQKRSNARKTSTLPSRIMTYDCLHFPRETEEVIRDCLRRTTSYYNTLVCLNAERMVKFCAVRAEAIPALAEVETRLAEVGTAIDAAYETLAADRDRVRKRIMPQEVLAKLSELKAERARLSAIRSELAKGFAKLIAPGTEELKRRKLAAFTKPDGTLIGPNVRAAITDRILDGMLEESEWPSEWKSVAQIEREHNLAGKAAYEPIDVWIYLMAQSQFAAAVKDTPGGVPREKRQDGEGRIGIRIDPRPGAELFRPGGALWLDPLPEDQWLTRSSRRQARTTAHITLIQKGGAPPIKLDLRIMMHRPLPTDAMIKTAWLLVRRVGGRMRCQLQMTIETEQMTRKNGSGAVALNLAWRKVEGGMRVGYWADTKGKHEEIVIPERLLSSMQFPDALRGLSDRLFNQAVEFLTAHVAAGMTLPAWMPEAIEHMAHWRGHGKLASVAYRLVRESLPEPEILKLWADWKRVRLAAELDLFAPFEVMESWFTERGVADATTRIALCLEWWRMKNRHLFEWEDNQRDQALASRKDLYRCVAAKLSKEYGELVFDSTNLIDMQSHPAPEEDSESWEMARRQRKFAATSILRDFCKERFGVKTKVEAAGNSSECADCGADFVHKMGLHGTCSVCGTTRDADLNNCLNQLGRAGHRERPGGEKTPGTARKTKKTSKTATVKKHKKGDPDGARDAAE